MAGYLAVSTKTYTVKDTCGTGTYSGYSKTATVKISISAAGKVSWSLSMASDTMFKGSFYLKIGSTLIYDTGYVKGSNSSQTLGNGFSSSGSFDTTAEKLAVDIRLAAGQDMHSSTDRFNGKTGEVTIKTDTITRTAWSDGGTPTCSISQTAGNNTVTFSGNRGSASSPNGIVSGTLKYTIGNGTEQSINLGTTSGGTYKTSITIASGDDGKTIKAKAVYDYTYGNDGVSSEDSKTCYYYSAGGTPTCTISQTAGSNTVTISGNKGTNGSHNAKTACKLYYNRGTGEANQVVDLGISGSTYSYTLPAMTSTNNNKTIGAYVTTTYTYGDAKTGYASSITSKYYSSVTAGTVTITDHGDNTFTITATKGGNGYNNTASGPSNLKWGYDTNYSNTYTSGTAIALATSGTGETRKVYAKADTTGQYFAAATKKAELGINQYMVPTSPSSAPVLDPSSFRNNRLTIKQNWKYTWGAASKRGKSGVAGYAVAVWQNGTKMTGLGYSGNTIILNKNNTNNFVAIPSTNCHVTFNPVTLGFKPGDTVALSVWGYSNYGTGTRIGYSNAVTSEDTTVQNAGIVRVYVNTGTATSPKYEWKEGQVHVYVNTGTASAPKYEWKEAAVVYTRVGSSWEESS